MSVARAASLALPPTARAPRLGPHQRDLLEHAAREGARIVAGIARGVGPPSAALEAASVFLYRRWVLEVLLLLRVRGELGFGDLARELGGLAGESLSMKLQPLQAGGFIERVETPRPARRVRYSLTPAGRRLGAAALTLTNGKVEHARALREGGSLPQLPEAQRAPRDARELDRAHAAFVEGCEAFAASRLAVAPEADVEAVLATARRFSETCVRKWHGAVLGALVARGPTRFAELRTILGCGDEALARALTTLASLGSLQRMAGGAYAIQAPGRFDLSLGLPPLLDVASSTRSERLHAA